MRTRTCSEVWLALPVTWALWPALASAQPAPATVPVQAPPAATPTTEQKQQSAVEGDPLDDTHEGFLEIFGLISIEGEPGAVPLRTFTQRFEQRLDDAPRGKERERGMNPEARRS